MSPRKKMPIQLSTSPMRSTQVLEPIQPGEELDKTQLKKIWLKIQEELKKMDMGEDITLDDFIKRLDIDEETYINAVRSSLKTTTIFLKRTPWEIRVNAYNTTLLKAWRANHDIQFVTNVYACAMYVASYITKGQRGMSQLLRKASQVASKGQDSIRQQLRSVANKFLNAVEISAQEAAYILLQIPMKKASRQVIFINTNPPEDRVFLLKPQDILDNLHDDDEYIQVSGLLDKYEKRSKKLENVCLADFACWYNSQAHASQNKRRRTGNAQQQQVSTDFLPENDDYDDEIDYPPLSNESPNNDTVTDSTADDKRSPKRRKVRHHQISPRLTFVLTTSSFHIYTCM
jgi:hypothetical protein